MTISYPFMFCVVGIPMSIVLAHINYKFIKKNMVGWVWHNVQFFSLYIVGYAACYWFYKDHLAASLQVLCLGLTHWIVFDYTLNVLRGLDELYIGYTSTIDVTWRKITYYMGEADRRTLFFVVKLFMLMSSLLVFHSLFEF